MVEKITDSSKPRRNRVEKVLVILNKIILTDEIFMIPFRRQPMEFNPIAGQLTRIR